MAVQVAPRKAFRGLPNRVRSRYPWHGPKRPRAGRAGSPHSARQRTGCAGNAHKGPARPASIPAPKRRPVRSGAACWGSDPVGSRGAGCGPLRQSPAAARHASGRAAPASVHRADIQAGTSPVPAPSDAADAVSHPSGGAATRFQSQSRPLPMRRVPVR